MSSESSWLHGSLLLPARLPLLPELSDPGQLFLLRPPLQHQDVDQRLGPGGYPSMPFSCLIKIVIGGAPLSKSGPGHFFAVQMCSVMFFFNPFFFFKKTTHFSDG